MKIKEGTKVTFPTHVGMNRQKSGWKVNDMQEISKTTDYATLAVLVEDHDTKLTHRVWEWVQELIRQNRYFGFVPLDIILIACRFDNWRENKYEINKPQDVKNWRGCGTNERKN